LKEPTTKSVHVPRLLQDIAIGLASDQPPVVPDGDGLAFELVRKALDLRTILARIDKKISACLKLGGTGIALSTRSIA
jgi:hypothetical protein